MDMRAPLGASSTKGALEVDRRMRRLRPRAILHLRCTRCKIFRVGNSFFPGPEWCARYSQAGSDLDVPCGAQLAPVALSFSDLVRMLAGDRLGQVAIDHGDGDAAWALQAAEDIAQIELGYNQPQK
jgi:hypothetical protein